MNAKITRQILARIPLVERVLSDATGTVLLCTPAGGGKSTLMAMVAQRLGLKVCALQHPRPDDVAGGWLLWDVPVSARAVRLSAQVAESVEHLVIAHRPEQRITGMAQRLLYNGRTTLDGEDLAFAKAELSSLPEAVANRLMEDFAGWPAFLPLAQTPDDPLVIAFIAESMLSHLTPEQTTSLTIWLEAPTPTPKVDWRDALPPTLFAAPHRHSALIEALRIAAGARLQAFSNSSAVTEVANTLEASNRPLAAIALLLDHGHEAHAAQILEHFQGLELIYNSSLSDFSEIVLRFSQEMLATNETVLFSVTRTLMKMGELERVRHLTSKHLGSDYLDPLKVLSRGSRFSFAARRFRLNMMISEDMTPSDAMLLRLGEFMADYPVGDAQKWGAFYNALLEFENRRRNFQKAESAAARALIYFRKMGGHPLLEFFIHLHLTVLHLTNGDLLQARPAARAARKNLENVHHSAEPEFRMLRLLEAAIAYEEGHPQKLVTFAQEDFEAFATAEIWPSMFVFAVFYVSQAIMDHFPATIRPGFLDGLWLHLAERMDLRRYMQARTAVAYQNESRWLEADDALRAAGASARDHLQLRPETLAHLSERDDIVIALAKLRSLAHERTPSSETEKQIDALEANPKTTLREKVALRLWRAHVDYQRKDAAAARRNLQSALQTVSRLGCFGVLSEERAFLAPLLREKRIRSHVETAQDIRAAISIYAGSINSPKAKARAGGLTERETQLLQLIADGYPNKRISALLGIAEPTVKFHLSRLYAKLGCGRRAEAVQAAHALGWL